MTKWHRLMVALFLTATLVVTVQQMTKPDEAKACGPCVAIAGVGAYELITTGLIAGAATYSGIKLHQVIDGASSKARWIKRHPARWDRFMKKVRGRRDFGHKVWKRSGKTIRGLARWTRNHVGVVAIKRHWPTGAWACVVSGTSSYLANHDLKDAAFACVGAFILGVTVPPGTRSLYGVESAEPTWYPEVDEGTYSWSSLYDFSGTDAAPAWVTALEPTP